MNAYRVHVSPAYLTLQREAHGVWLDKLAWRRFYPLTSPYFYGELRDFEDYCEQCLGITIDEDTDFHEDA